VNTLELCQSYPWPGNIRELQNIVERSVILTTGDIFSIEKAWLTSPEPPRQELPSPLPDTLQNQARELIETALAECNGKVAGQEGAAAKRGIPRSTLDSKSTKYQETQVYFGIAVSPSFSIPETSAFPEASSSDRRP
jgi:DNA-binding NtrC family response regulator